MSSFEQLEGRELEDEGHNIFVRMGLQCFHRLNNVRLKDIDPDGTYTNDDHLEIDYLIVFGEVCLVGEITARTAAKSAKKKYQKYVRHLHLLSNMPKTRDFWQKLGVPDDEIKHFSKVKSLKGFFVLTRLQRFDVLLPPIQDIAIFYKSDWAITVNYAQTIGEYARYPFWEKFDVTIRDPIKVLKIREGERLRRITDRKVARSVGSADIYTFEISPYRLLPIARVYRRDDWVSATEQLEAEDYQRALNIKKLEEIRQNLLGKTSDFLFPSNILVVLSNECKYDKRENCLEIPEIYGSVEVVDGQHRLFSYADENIRAIQQDRAVIMVTAIQFLGATDEVVRNFSAKTFIEINTNQTKVKSDHIHAIAYELLGETYPKALAAQIVLGVNEREGSLYGFFQTHQTGLGIIQVRTVLTALATITNMDTIQRLAGNIRGDRSTKKRQGYENLFSASIDELTDTDVFIKKGISCLGRFFDIVAKVFKHDWPKRNEENRSALAYAKVIAGFVRLLNQFIIEGKDWNQVETELIKIRKNIMELRGMSNYDSLLLDPTHQHIPDSTPRDRDDFKFLNRNREKPTSITAIASKDI